MDILLFDSGSESARVWQHLANAQQLTCEVQSHWPGEQRLPDCPIVIVDQSAIPSEFSKVVAEVARKRPHQMFVVTGAGLMIDQVVEVMRAGVNFVFEKPLNAQLLDASLRKIVEESRSLREKREEYKKLKSLFGELTSREKDVLDYVLEGVPNKKTAEELSVSVRTIEARRAKVYHKTESSCVVELVRKVDRLARLARIFEVKEIVPVMNGTQIPGLVPTPQAAVPQAAMPRAAMPQATAVPQAPTHEQFYKPKMEQKAERVC